MRAAQRGRSISHCLVHFCILSSSGTLLMAGAGRCKRGRAGERLSVSTVGWKCCYWHLGLTSIHNSGNQGRPALLTSSPSRQRPFLLSPQDPFLQHLLSLYIFSHQIHLYLISNFYGEASLLAEGCNVGGWMSCQQCCITPAHTHVGLVSIKVLKEHTGDFEC